MKRSSSAPMIPELVAGTIKPLLLPSSLSPTIQGASSLQSRRGLSTSNISLPSDFTRPEGSPRKQPLASPIPFSRINSPTSRQHQIERIKKEEAIDERRDEREVRECIRLSQSCEDLKLVNMDPELPMEVFPPPPSATLQSFMPPLSPLSRMRSRSLTPTSPSARVSVRRSCSPILRPSTLSLGKRRRDAADHQEEMDTSPVFPNAKRLQLTFNNTPSPSVSPHRSNSPLHTSFSTSRKSSNQSESTPLSSPSSLTHNPFAVNYDSGNLEHWHSGGSTGSSAAHSPLGGPPLRQDGRLLLTDEGRIHSALHSHAPVGNSSPGIIIDEHRSVPLENCVDVSSEAPTPLSPKGLQFRYRPFASPTVSLPSPIPRVAQGSVNTNPGVVSPKPNSLQTSPRHLTHDKYLSPFNSGSDYLSPNHTHSHSLSHGRGTWSKGHSQLLTSSSLGMTRQSHPGRHDLTRLDHKNTPLSTSSSSSSRVGFSSPLSKLSLSAGEDSPGSANSNSGGRGASGGREGGGGGRGGNSVLLGVMQPCYRSRGRRRESETSNDSHEDSLMESDSCSLVSSLEESLEIIDSSSKELDAKVDVHVSAHLV